MSQVVFNVVSEDVKEPHIPQYMHPARMQKHRGEEGNSHRSQGIIRRPLQSQGQMIRHHAKSARKQLIAARIKRRLKQVHENIQHD